MSLVHQALRKAEQEKLRKTGVVPEPVTPRIPLTPTAAPIPTSRPATPAPTSPPPAAPASAPSTSFLPALLSIVAFVAIVAMVYLVIRATTIGTVTTGPATTTPPAAASNRDDAMPASPAAPSVEAIVSPAPPAPVREQKPEVNYDLTGITQFPDGRQAAVINGQLRSEEQYVDGAIVRRIAGEEVTLELDGESFVIRLK